MDVALDDNVAVADAELLRLLNQDPFFQAEPTLLPANVQSLAHLTRTRNVGSLLGSAEQTEEEFQQHSEAIRLLEMLCHSVRTVATELTSSLKALKKLKELEEKEVEKERIKQEKAAERKEQQEKKKAAAKAKKAAEALEKANQNADGEKKRRAPSRINSEMTDSDPKVLKARFPDNQIPVLETLDSRLEFGIFSFQHFWFQLF